MPRLTVSGDRTIVSAASSLPLINHCTLCNPQYSCWNKPKRSGRSDVKMFEILHRDWNLKPIFTQKWAPVDMNWGGVKPLPPSNSNTGNPLRVVDSLQHGGLGSEIAASLSLVHGFGTVYRPPCVVLTPNLVNSNDWWRCTCLWLLIRAVHQRLCL